MPDNRITRAAAQLREAMLREAELTRELSLIQARRRELEELELPAAFTEFGVGANLSLESGDTLSRSLEVTGSLPKRDANRRQRGLDWARANGYGDTIRCVVVVSYPAGDEDKARALQEYLRGDNSANVTVMENIHHSTLQAIGRSRAQEGLATPFEDLGLNIVRKVELVMPRQSRVNETE